MLPTRARASRGDLAGVLAVLALSAAVAGTAALVLPQVGGALVAVLRRRG
ncbi:hypothetical protein JOD57_002245 [Geodermatophilus bullaregiensis]|nr:hypothetical protein [Geodermatophilus bullaregiensis]MBM7806408.1 hypothetical protein [Geodermatophilus bullaregiensis]